MHGDHVSVADPGAHASGADPGAHASGGDPCVHASGGDPCAHASDGDPCAHASGDDLSGVHGAHGGGEDGKVRHQMMAQSRMVAGVDAPTHIGKTWR